LSELLDIHSCLGVPWNATWKCYFRRPKGACGFAIERRA